MGTKDKYKCMDHCLSGGTEWSERQFFYLFNC